MTLEAGDAYGQASFGGEVSDGGSVDVNAGASIEGTGGEIRLSGGPSYQGEPSGRVGITCRDITLKKC
jgi:hypothetical protein